MKRTVKHNAGHRAKAGGICCLVFCLLFTTYGAQAAYITFHDEFTEDTGTGFGNVLGTLVLQDTPSESGSVTWNGTNDVRTGDAKNQSQTVTVTQLTSKGFDVSNLIVILNLNQSGSSPWLDVHSFTMRFYTAANGSSYFDALYDVNDVRNTASTLGLSSEDQGTGSAGYVFRITFEGTEGATFFGGNDHRIGMLVQTPIDNEANGGPDSFYMGDADVNEVIPEPATLGFLLVSGLALMGCRRKA